jgi:hypothetical protein
MKRLFVLFLVLLLSACTGNEEEQTMEEYLELDLEWTCYDTNCGETQEFDELEVDIKYYFDYLDNTYVDAGTTYIFEPSEHSSPYFSFRLPDQSLIESSGSNFSTYYYYPETNQITITILKFDIGPVICEKVEDTLVCDSNLPQITEDGTNEEHIELVYEIITSIDDIIEEYNS